MKKCRPSYFILKLTLIILYTFGQSIAQTDDVVTIDYCDLVKDAEKHDKKIVRVNGQYIVGFEASILRNDKCENSSSWVEFDDSFERATNSEILKKFNQLTDTTPKKTKDGGIIYPAGIAEVTIIAEFFGIKPSQTIGGRKFTFGFGHLNGFDYKLKVLQIENVQEPTKTK